MRSLLTPLFTITLSLSLATGCKSKPQTQDDQSLITETSTTSNSTDKAEAKIYTEKALQAAEEGNWRSATSYYTAATKNDPDNWKLYLDLAIAQSKVPDFQAAITSIRLAMEKGGERDWLTWYNLGNVYQNRGMYHESIDAYRVALGLTSSTNLDILVNISSGYVFLGKYEEAQETISHILTIEPQELRALHNAALIPHLKTDYEEALIAYDAVLAIDPNFAQSLFNKAHVLSSLKRYSEASRYYELYIQADPDGPYVNRARTRAEEYKKQ